MLSRFIRIAGVFTIYYSQPLAVCAQPNVIIVMTDDQGYPELSAHGNPILHTPNLDRLHGQSIRFSDYHVSPMCTPTRGQLLTGLDAARNGAVNVSSGRALLRSENPTMANYFGDAGYSTGIFGKWHLGANYPYRPQDRGFQESVWYPSSSIPSVPAYWGNDYFDDVYVHNGKEKLAVSPQNLVPRLPWEVCWRGECWLGTGILVRAVALKKASRNDTLVEMYA